MRMTHPILLVAGFLGGGKTTLLRRLAREAAHTGRRLVFIVNEFSETDVDAGLLRADGGSDTIGVAGGSIFCRCKVTEFVDVLSGLRTRIATEGLEGVVIEASGMADPRVMETMLRETKLDAFYRQAQVVLVLDPGRFLKLCRTLPVIMAQAESADLILLNKTDLYSEAVLCEAEAAIRARRPDVVLRRTIRCETAFEWFPHASHSRVPAGRYAPCRDPNFDTVSLNMRGGVADFEQVRRAVEAVREAVYRVKGLVRTPAGAVELWEDAGAGLTRAEAPPGAQPTPLVVVCRGREAERVRVALAAALAR